MSSFPAESAGNGSNKKAAGNCGFFYLTTLRRGFDGGELSGGVSPPRLPEDVGDESCPWNTSPCPVSLANIPITAANGTTI